MYSKVANQMGNSNLSRSINFYNREFQSHINGINERIFCGIFRRVPFDDSEGL